MCFDCSGYGRSGGPTCSVELGENQGVSESRPCSSTHHRIVLVQGITTHFKDLLYYHQKMFAQKELSTRNGLKYRENWSNHFFDTLSPPPLPFLLLLLLFWCEGRGQGEKNVDQKKNLQENGQISFSHNMTAPSPIPTLVPLSPYRHRHPCYPLTPITLVTSA